MTEMFGEAWSPMSVPDLAPDDDDDDGILLFGGAAAHQLRPLKSLQKRALKLDVKISSTNVFKVACVLPLQSLTDFQSKG